MTNEKLNDNIICNPNVARCMSFVKDVLQQVMECDGKFRRVRRKKATDQIPFPYEILDKFEYSGDLPITKFISKMYEPLEDKNYPIIKYDVIRDWLIKKGYLERRASELLNKFVIRPTQKGEELGIRERLVEGKVQSFYSITYNKNAQEFIISNMRGIIEGNENEEL